MQTVKLLTNKKLLVLATYNLAFTIFVMMVMHLMICLTFSPNDTQELQEKNDQTHFSFYPNCVRFAAANIYYISCNNLNS